MLIELHGYLSTCVLKMQKYLQQQTLLSLTACAQKSLSSTTYKCIFFKGIRGAKFCRFVLKCQRDHYTMWMWET